MTQDLTLDAIVDLLDLHHQRATYRAVGDYLGQAHTEVTRGLPRTPRLSWIVSQGTQLPRNYTVGEQHVDLEAKEFVLETGAELRKWLGHKAAQAARVQMAAAGRTAGAKA